MGVIVAETTNERECSRVAAHSLLHAFCSPLKIPDATATNLIHPRVGSRTQHTETTTQRTYERPFPRFNIWNAARTAPCRNRMPPTPLSKPLWITQQTSYGGALPPRLQDNSTPDRGTEPCDRFLTTVTTTQSRTFWLDHTSSLIKPLQEQNQQLIQRISLIISARYVSARHASTYNLHGI